MPAHHVRGCRGAALGSEGAYLHKIAAGGGCRLGAGLRWRRRHLRSGTFDDEAVLPRFASRRCGRGTGGRRRRRDFRKIGRASCRGRVGPYVLISGVAVSLKKKTLTPTPSML